MMVFHWSLSESYFVVWIVLTPISNFSSSLFKSFEDRSSSAPISIAYGQVEYTNCLSAESDKIPPTNVLFMTLNNLMVKLQ